MPHQRRKDPLVWGLILIAVGTLFILEKFDIRIWDSVWRLWPAILIVWGGLKVYNGLREKKEIREEIGRAPQAKP